MNKITLCTLFVAASVSAQAAVVPVFNANSTASTAKGSYTFSQELSTQVTMATWFRSEAAFGAGGDYNTIVGMNGRNNINGSLTLHDTTLTIGNARELSLASNAKLVATNSTISLTSYIHAGNAYSGTTLAFTNSTVSCSRMNLRSSNNTLLLHDSLLKGYIEIAGGGADNRIVLTGRSAITNGFQLSNLRTSAYIGPECSVIATGTSQFSLGTDSTLEVDGGNQFYFPKSGTTKGDCALEFRGTTPKYTTGNTSIYCGTSDTLAQPLLPTLRYVLPASPYAAAPLYMNGTAAKRESALARAPQPGTGQGAASAERQADLRRRPPRRHQRPGVALRARGQIPRF